MFVTPTINSSSIVGVILAGGLSRRMQHQNKSLLQLGDKTLLEKVRANAATQVDTLLLNSNTPTEELGTEITAQFADVIADSIEGFAGPLAGILAAMEWCEQHRPEAQWLASFAVDTPFFPTDLIAQFSATLADLQGDYICAASYGRRHPLFALWPIKLTGELRKALTETQLRKVQLWTNQYATIEVDFTPANSEAPDPFFNINTPDDVASAERWLQQP